MEAVRTNVLGADNVLRAAMREKVSRVIVLSTDKAVYPINAMGMSKALMERVMVAKSRHCDPALTVFCATRYGNVMRVARLSNPAVLESTAQYRAIDDDRPEDGEISHVPSCKSVGSLYSTHSSTVGQTGTFWCKNLLHQSIGDLAEAMRQLLSPTHAIRVICTRHGEKLYESLVSREEMARREDLGAYYRIPADSRDLNYDRYFVEGEPAIANFDDYTSHSTRRLSVAEVKDVLLKLPIIREAVRASRSRLKLSVCT